MTDDDVSRGDSVDGLEVGYDLTADSTLDQDFDSEPLKGWFSTWRMKRRMADVVNIFSLADVFQIAHQMSFRDLENLVSRQRLGSRVFRTYVGLFVVALSLPLLVHGVISWGDPAAFSSGLRDAQDYAVAGVAALSFMAGLLGYVVGRHFEDSGSGGG